MPIVLRDSDAQVLGALAAAAGRAQGSIVVDRERDEFDRTRELRRLSSNASLPAPRFAGYPNDLSRTRDRRRQGERGDEDAAPLVSRARKSRESRAQGATGPSAADVRGLVGMERILAEQQSKQAALDARADEAERSRQFRAQESERARSFRASESDESRSFQAGQQDERLASADLRREQTAAAKSAATSVKVTDAARSLLRLPMREFLAEADDKPLGTTKRLKEQMFARGVDPTVRRELAASLRVAGATPRTKKLGEELAQKLEALATEEEGGGVGGAASGGDLQAKAQQVERFVASQRALYGDNVSGLMREALDRAGMSVDEWKAYRASLTQRAGQAASPGAPAQPSRAGEWWGSLFRSLAKVPSGGF